VTQQLFTLLLLLSSVVASAATYPPNIDYGSQGDFIVKLGTQYGRTADLTLIGPILVNMPEGPGSTDVDIDEYRFEDTAWDLSDLMNPTFIRSLTNDVCCGRQPVQAHGTAIAFIPELGPLLWWGDDWLRFDPGGATSAEQIVEQEFTGWGFAPLSYPMMFSPYYSRTYWQYGFDSSGLYAIHDVSQPLSAWSEDDRLGVNERAPWLGEPVLMWDHLGLTGVTGFTAWLGNLLVVASDQQSTGIAIYDVSGFREGRLPRLLSTLNPSIEEPPWRGTENSVGIGGYWVEPYGANKMVFAARERFEATPRRMYPAMYVVDFTDPTDPRLSCQLYFNLDEDDPADGDYSSDPMYVNFQDNYAYLDHFKVDLERCESAYADGNISQGEFSQIVYKFDDIANGCDSSQYFRPLGQVGVFGGHDFETPTVNEQGMCFFITSDAPDTNPPYVSGHRPLDGQSNYPVDGFIHIHIPETLRTETVMDAITIFNVATGEEIEFKHQLTHTGTIAIWPEEYLDLDVTYQVNVVGIQDFMGNTMEPYSFTFATGDDVGDGIPVPDPANDGGQIVPSYSGTPYYPNQSSQLACEPEVDNGSVWAVNPDNDSVTIIDRQTDAQTFEVTHNVSREIRLNYETPTSVTKVDDNFAITHRDDDKVVIYNGAGYPLRAIDTGHGTQPVASVANGSTLFVSLFGSNEVVAIDAASGEVMDRLAVASTPYAMALFGERLLVTRFISTSQGGQVYDIDTSGSQLTLVRTIAVNKVQVPDDIDHGSGVPNYLSSIVISAGGTSAYVTANKANIDRGILRNGLPLDDDSTVRPMIVTLDLENNRDANVDPTTRLGSIDLDNGADPSGITYLADPAIRVHSLRGNNVVVVNNLDANTTAQFNTGFAPQGMCTTLRTLYVKNFTGRSVSAIDVAGFMFDGSVNPAIVTLPTVSSEKLNPQELQGLRTFYHSSIPAMGQEGYMSCATCHAEGGDDGMVWDISNLGEGFRNTLSLNGASGTRFGELHWSGNFDEVQDFELQMEQLNGGDGLIEGLTFNGQSPMDYVSTGQSEQLDALAAYVASLGRDSVRRSPYRTYTGALTESAQRGREIFNNGNCADCHVGSAFRDGLNHDVGTIDTTSGNRLGDVLSTIRTPSLIELWKSAPYYHDGSAVTLNEVLERGDHARSLSPQEEGDLVEYLLSIDRELYIDDDVEFVPGPTPIALVTVTIVNGVGSGDYEIGDSVDIVASAAPVGQVFSGWVGDVTNVVNTSSPNTQLLVPEFNITITASYSGVEDTQSPAAPSSLIVSDVSATAVTASWSAASDNVGVAEYMVLLNGTEYAARTAGTSLRLFGLSPSTSYDIAVVAFDAAGNQSPQSNTETVQTLVGGTVSEQQTYFFGHSLIFHTNSDHPNLDELSVPHWVYLLTQEAGQGFSADGEFRTSNYAIPPVDQWAFGLTPSAWQGSFAASDYDAVVYTELNYVDYQAPTEAYDGSRSDDTPVNSVLRVLDYVRAQEPGVDFYIYENWPAGDFHAPDYDPPNSNTPPTSQQFSAYHDYTRGEFHDWWLQLHDLVVAARPGANIKMVPVGPIISGLLSESGIGGLSSIPFEDLYEDNAPHGRPTIYFLAGLVQYMAMYQEPAPSDFAVPNSVDAEVAANYNQIVDYIWNELNAFEFPEGTSRVW